jgi:Zn-dependent protease
MEIFIKILCLVLAVVLHELSHGLAAYSFGDTTAKQMGHLSLNPIKHIDPLGSIILPFLLFITNAPFLIGWAKPVPVDFSKLNPKTLGTFLVAFAGPMMNISLAIIASILWKVGILPTNIATMAVQINVILAAFNMLPILPLDGGRMITCFLPQGHPIFLFFERFGMIIIIGSLVLFKEQVHRAILTLANILLGLINTLT